MKKHWHIAKIPLAEFKRTITLFFSYYYSIFIIPLNSLILILSISQSQIDKLFCRKNINNSNWSYQWVATDTMYPTFSCYRAVLLTHTVVFLSCVCVKQASTKSVFSFCTERKPEQQCRSHTNVFTLVSVSAELGQRHSAAHRALGTTAIECALTERKCFSLTGLSLSVFIHSLTIRNVFRSHLLPAHSTVFCWLHQPSNFSFSFHSCSKAMK